MSYLTNRRAVEQVLDHLEILASSSENVIFFRHLEPSKFAYALRQGFFAAKMHDEFQRYHPLKETWKVFVTTKGVECRRRDEDGDPHAPAKQVGSITLSEITILHGVLGAALRFKSAEELVFPNVQLGRADQISLYNWTATQDWQYIDHMGEGVTLTKKSVDMDLVWSPED